MSNIIVTAQRKFMALDKSSIRNISADYALKVNDGQIDAVEALILSKKIQELGKSIEEEVRPIAEDTHTIGQREELVKYDAKIIHKETGVKYDFSACEDSEWYELKAKLEDVSEAIKTREKFLKNLTKPMADPDTGEVINPPIRSGKLGLAVTLR